jgi:hypothetical protein
MIQPLRSAVGYADMEEFVMRVRDPRARHMLKRQSRAGAPSATLRTACWPIPELRSAWFAFHDARGAQRAIDWLTDHALVNEGAAEEARGKNREPDFAEMPGMLDAHGILRQLAGELRRLYRRRLRLVILVGAWERGDAVAESPRIRIE